MAQRTRSQPPTEPAAPPPQTNEELTLFVEQLLDQMQSRFTAMSDTIMSRIDDMGSRIDELESSIGQMLTQAGVSEDDIAAEDASAPDPAALSVPAPASS